MCLLLGLFYFVTCIVGSNSTALECYFTAMLMLLIIVLHSYLALCCSITTEATKYCLGFTGYRLHTLLFLEVLPGFRKVPFACVTMDLPAHYVAISVLSGFC